MATKGPLQACEPPTPRPLHRVRPEALCWADSRAWAAGSRSLAAPEVPPILFSPEAGSEGSRLVRINPEQTCGPRLAFNSSLGCRDVRFPGCSQGSEAGGQCRDGEREPMWGAGGWAHRLQLQGRLGAKGWFSGAGQGTGG